MSVAVLASFALWQCTLAATTTTVSNPAKTYCPLLNPIKISEPGSICRTEGNIQNPFDVLSRSCWNRDSRSCYRACAQDPKCRSFGVDVSRNLCINYGKSLADLGFESGPSDVVLSDFQGCYACNSTLQQRSSYCPNTPTRINPPLKNYTCGVAGTFADDQVTIRHGVATFEECYGFCSLLDQYGGCSSFAWDSRGGGTRCNLFLRSLYQKGFKAAEGEPKAWSLRGCFECNEPTPPPDPCVPPTFPPQPQLKNGNFSRTQYSTRYRKLEPQDWNLEGNTTRAVKTSDGNTYVRMFVDGSHGRPQRYASIYQYIYGFDRNPSSPGHFYNMTYDVALEQYNAPEPGGYYCSLYVGYPYPVSTKIQNTTFPKTFKTMGPVLIDASVSPRDDLQIRFTVTCKPGYAGANVTILLDNVRISQNGHEVQNI